MLEATISRFFSYPAIGVIFDKYILSVSLKLADAYPADNLYSCHVPKLGEHFCDETGTEFFCSTLHF